MKSNLAYILIAAFLCCISKSEAQPTSPDANAARPGKPAPIERRMLGEPNNKSTVSLEEVMTQQKKVTGFLPMELENYQLRQLSWAAQKAIETSGMNQRSGGITMNLYFCLSAAVYHYNQVDNSLDPLVSTDVRNALAAAIPNAAILKEAPCFIIIAGSVGLNSPLSRAQARDAMMLDAGRISQNIAFEAQTLGLGVLNIGSFDIGKVRRVARLPLQAEPVYIVAVGYPAASATPAEQAPRQQQTRVLLIQSGGSPPDELFNIKDMLTESGIRTTVAISGPITLRYDNTQRQLVPDVRMQDVAPGDYNAVVIVGGATDPGFMRDPLLIGIIRTAVNKGKFVGATGDTVQVLANAGVLNGVRATGTQRLLINSGCIYTGKFVEADQRIITALNNLQSTMFARAIINALTPKEAVQPVQPTIR